jgi:hypothetical protein
MNNFNTLEPMEDRYQPNTFEKGHRYLLRIRQNNGRKPIFRPVKFMGYTPCPAVVIVSESEGWIQRVDRVDLYGTDLEKKLLI